MSINYRVVGDDMQMAVVTLEQDETVIAEAGAMIYMDEGIAYSVKLGDGAEDSFGVVSRIIRAGKRAIAKESFFLTHFTNKAVAPKEIAFSAPYPGKIIPIHLSDTVNGSFICQKGSFLCAEYGTRIDITFTKRLSVGFFGGEGFVLERLSGDGVVFLHACGSIIEKNLHGQTLTVEAGCIVGFEETIDYSVKPVGGMKSMLFGGEGMFFATLSGTGKVYLQSLPFSKLVGRIISAIPEKDND